MTKINVILGAGFSLEIDFDSIHEKTPESNGHKENIGKIWNFASFWIAFKIVQALFVPYLE